MTRALARELGSRNITVNCIAPGFIDTDMTKALSAEQIGALAQDKRSSAMATKKRTAGGELAAALKCWHRLTGEEAAELVAFGAALKEEVDQLHLAEEGAKEAFGHVVQQKRDLEAEVKRLRELLAEAYKMVPQQRHEA